MDFEAAIFAVILGLAAWPLVARWLRKPLAAPQLAVVLAAAGTAVAVAWFVGGMRGVETPEPLVVDRPVQIPRDGYVTSDNCRSCHPVEYSSWHASYHRTMTQAPTPQNVRGDFDNRRVEVYGHRYLLERRGEEFWCELDYISPLDQEQTSYARVWRKIVLVTGSHRMQIYWTSPEGSRRLEMLPIVYLYETERWVPRGSVFLLPDSESYHGEIGRWNEGCIVCHTTRGESGRHDAFDFDTTVAEFGIACEACHGPGHEHVTANRVFTHRYRNHSKTNDATIFHPHDVRATYNSEMCGQCHATARIMRHDYQPSERLAGYRTPVRKGDPEIWEEAKEKFGQAFLDNTFWPDGMIRVSGREYNGLLETPCYTHGDESRGVMSCLSCHSMHRSSDDKRAVAEWTDDQLKPGMRSNEACLQCHSELRAEERLTKHTRHQAGSSGSLCYNCHMPFTTYGLLKSMRSHTVSSPNVRESVEAGRPNACNLCHLDEPLQWTAGYLESWRQQETPPIPAEQKNVAASIDWLLRGDAGQRALLAWAMGWPPAREVSGTDWMTPHLARLLDDPYDAVRFIARRSLLKQPGFEGFEYDFVAPAEERKAAVGRALELWSKVHQPGNILGRTNLLFDSNGQLDRKRSDDIASERDDKPVHLLE